MAEPYEPMQGPVYQRIATDAGSVTEAPDRAPEIHGELAKLDASVDSLGKAWGRLEDRMASVLRPMEPETSNPQDSEALYTPLAQGIAGQRHRVEALTREIGRALQRLEV